MSDSDLTHRNKSEPDQCDKDQIDASSEPSSGFVAISQFAIANGMISEVKESFQNRPHLVDSVPGFLRMEVLSPLDAVNEIWLMTFWMDESSFRAWHHSHLYHQSHKGIPKGLKLIPDRTSLRYFQHVSS